MFQAIDILREMFPIYMLVFTRVSAMLLTLPVFGYQTVPGKVRLMLSLAITLLIAMPLSKEMTITYDSHWELFSIVGSELLIGLMIGIGARFIFEAVTIAGSFISMQVGMGMMQVVDPNSSQQQPIVSQLLFMVVLVYFLALDGHHMLLEALFNSFKLIVPGGARFQSELGVHFISGGSLMYDLAFRLAAPALVFLILIDISLAFVTRMMPQANIFFISLPLKLGVGMVILILTLNIVQLMFAYLMQNLALFLDELLQLL